MKQQFIAMIDKKIERYFETPQYQDNHAYDKWAALQELRDEVEKMDSEWISVKDRMPTEKWEYIVWSTYTNSSEQSTYTWIKNRLWDFDWGYITHWQPLPSAPNL